MLVRIAAVSQLTPGTVAQVDAGGNEYAVCNVNGTVYALDGICPHAGGPLGEGALQDHMIVCPGTPGSTIAAPARTISILA